MNLETILFFLILSLILSFGYAYLLKIALFRIAKVRIHYFRAYIITFLLSIVSVILMYFLMLPFKEISLFKNDLWNVCITFSLFFVFTFLLLVAFCATLIKGNNGKPLGTFESIYVSLTYVGLKIAMFMLLYCVAIVANLILLSGV